MIEASSVSEVKMKKVIVIYALIAALLGWHGVNGDFCESISTTPVCDPSAYRSLSGLCNNLERPFLGSANTRLARLLNTSYSDGISTPPTAAAGGELPSARLISLTVFNDTSVENPRNTIVFMQLGQFIAHDMADGGRKPVVRGCCNDKGQLTATRDEHCFSIPVPNNDPIHKGKSCLNLFRDFTDLDAVCPNLPPAPIQQINTVTAFLDLSVVYGNSFEDLQPIRSFQQGKMSVESRNNQNWLPHNPSDSKVCEVQSGGTCYLGGDSRLNQSPHLTLIHTLFVREHNRLAAELQALNPAWSDEKLFEEARRINIAQFQKIVYYDWLPNILGQSQMEMATLIQASIQYVNDYSAHIDPSVINEHTAVAMRFFHTHIEGHLRLLDESRGVVGIHRLSDDLDKPGVLENADHFQCFARGMATQPAQATDRNYDAEIRSFFNKRNHTFGEDLKARDIQRDRDHGIARYNDMRAFSGLKRAQKWDDYLDVISREDLNKLKLVYANFNDVDLSVGGALEKPTSELQSQGPTYSYILMKQFFNTRKGDRFFFENESAGFSLLQLESIRKASLASIICKNSGNVQTVQPDVFKLVTANDSGAGKVNAIVSCADIPALDISLWRG